MANRIQNLLQKQDTLLTKLALGYSNPAFAGTALFPEVMVPKENVRVPEYGKEALKVYNAERALRAESNVLEPDDITLTDVKLREYDLAFPIDYREIDTTRDIFNLQQYATNSVMEALKLRQEKNIADLATNAANYGTNNKITLAGTSQWSHASSTPILQMATARAAIRTASGRYPNTLLIGAAAYEALREHATILDKIKYTQRGVATPEILASLFNVDEVVIGQSIYVSTTGTFTDVWGDYAVLAYVAKSPAEQRNPYAPSFGYTLTHESFPSVDTYTDTGGKVTYVRGTLLTETKILSAGCGYLFSDCIA